MAVTEPAKKVCVVCGQDVSGKPRVKDSQGRYVCAGACQEEYSARVKGGGAAADAAAPVKATKRGGSVMDDLIAASPMMSAVNCPSCNSPMAKDSVLCTRCGFNTQSGKAVKTHVVVEKARKEAKGPGVATKLSSGALGLLLSPLVSGLILAAVYACVGLAATQFKEALIGAYVLFGVSNVVCIVWAVAEAFNEGEHTMAGLMIYQFSLFIPFFFIRISAFVGVLVMLWYVFVTCDNGRLKGLYAATIIGNIALIVGYAMQQS